MQHGIQRNYFYFMIKRHFQKRKFAHSLHQMNSSSLLRTMLAFLIKETWKTPRLAAILDFNELERLGMNKANYGQQPCHCRLGESWFDFGGLMYGKPNVAIFNITIFIQFYPYIDLIFLYLFNLIL